jgi:enoyl-CoA hydratase/carnithine racemase/NADPH:quinone reductase-like Zn-dependent oxidoreductase
VRDPATPANDVDLGQADAGAIPVGAPFRPGLDPLPRHQHAWAVLKDRWGRPGHGEPRDALHATVTRVPSIGPNEALGYVLYAGLTYNTIFAARGTPISVFALPDEDVHIAGSGAVVLVAALGSEVAREMRLKVGELRVLYPGVSNLLSPRAGADPMQAEFKIQGYETPDGSFAQFVRCQAPQLLAQSERLALPDGASFMLDLETVFKALYDVARVESGARVFVEGAAGGTGLYAVACAVLRGARVTGLVSTEEKGKLVMARGGHAYVNRKAPELDGVFGPVPLDPLELGLWREAGERFGALVRARNDGAPIDVVVSSVGRDLFPRMVDLLGPGGRLVFYGATSGYTLTFLGKPGAASAADMYRRADLRPNDGVLVYYGGAPGADAVGDDAIASAVERGARVVVAVGQDAEGARVRARPGVVGVVSLETLARNRAFRWPATMPDYDLEPERHREYQDATLKPFGQAVGQALATGDNPRGYPDVIVERASQDSLGVSAFIARPHTGRVIFLEATERQRLSFYAPNVWMHQKRILFPRFSILGSHLSNAHQAEEVVRLVDAGALAIQPPAVHPWPALAEAHQAMAENRHTGTLTIRVGATPALDRARTAREVFEAWGSRFLDGVAVRVRLDPVRPRHPELIALVTIDSPPANAIGRTTLEDLERAMDALESERGLRSAVITGAGAMFVAGADIRHLRAFARAEDVAEFAARAQRVFGRIARSRAPFVAAVDGYALGGGNELQMACAYRVGSARAELGQPEINLHVIPGFGGTQMLPRLALRRAAASGGQGFAAIVEALAVLLDGRRRSAADAVAVGVLDEVAPTDALSHALGIARRIALGDPTVPLWSPLVQRSTIAFPNVERDPEIQRLLAHHAEIPRSAPAGAVVRLVRLGLTAGIDHGLEAERDEFGRLVASDDGRAGIDRFLGRRSLPLPLRRSPDSPR